MNSQTPRARRAPLKRIPTFFWEYPSHKPPVMDADSFRLSIGGLCANQEIFALGDLDTAFTRVTIERPMYCVNGWSMTREWSGFRLRDVVERACPSAEAKFLRATSVGGYEDTTGLDEMLEGDPLLATHLDGEPLSPERGHPLRLLIFHLYQFKGVKALTSLELVADYRKGTWAKVGYDDATILNACHLDIDTGEDVLPEPHLIKTNKPN